MLICYLEEDIYYSGIYKRQFTFILRFNNNSEKFSGYIE